MSGRNADAFSDTRARWRPTPLVASTAIVHHMALIPLSDWIDRFGDAALRRDPARRGAPGGGA